MSVSLAVGVVAVDPVPSGGTTGQVLAKKSNGDYDTEWVTGGGVSGVSQIVAGTNVTISPTGGTGVVTINATGGGSGAVSSVNGQTGAVVLGYADVGAASAAQGTLASTAVQPGSLATVATTGAYSDLTGKPTIPAAQVNSDWNAVSGIAQILNKPSLATVATTGLYSDLTGKPTLGTAAAANTTDFATAAQGTKADSALQPAAIGVSVQAYDADLTSWAAITPSSKQDTLVSGTNIKTINGSSILGSGNLVVGGGGGSPGGSNTQVQYNSVGSFAGDAGFTWDGTTVKATNVEATGGVLADSSFSGTYVDGIVVDYTTGAGRISVGGADSLNFYNGGIAGSLLGSVNNNGDWDFNGNITIGTATPLTGAVNPLSAIASASSGYIQSYIYNTTNGTSSSSDFTCYPHNGVDTSGWIDVGITSLSYADTTYTCTGPNEGYIFMSAPSGSSTTGNLVYATDSTGSANAHQWYVGGFTQAKSAYKMQLNATNLLVKQPIQANGVIESTTGGFKFPDASVQTTAATPFVGGILTSQLKLAAGTATAATAPLEFTSGTLNTTAEAGALEYDGTAYYSSVAASTRGVMPSEQVTVLNGTYTLTSQTAAQKLFNATTNGAVTLPVGTYQFECSFALTGMSATSGSFGFALGGAATKTYSYNAIASKGTSTALTTASATTATFNTGAQTTLNTAGTGTAGTAVIRGIIRVTVAGTVIPQVSLTVASAAIIQAGSYFKVSPVGSATVTTVGNWS